MTETSGNAKVVEALTRMLADSYTLYLKTHNYHWNVTGPMFTTLHTLFEQQYTELAMAVDEIAERVRTLGARAPGSFTEFTKLVAAARAVIEAGEEMRDQPTVDLATRRAEVHQKNAWMLRSHLE